MRFTQQDFEGALDFVGDLYDHRGLEDFADRTMSSLMRIIAAERVIYGDFDVEQQRARLSMQPAIVKEPDGTVDGLVNGALAGLESCFGQHPLYRYFLQTGDGQPHKITQVMTRSQYAADSNRIPGSIRVPPDQVTDWAANQDKKRLVVAYCT